MHCSPSTLLLGSTFGDNHPPLARRSSADQPINVLSIAQLVERRTVMVSSSSAGPLFESGLGERRTRSSECFLFPFRQLECGTYCSASRGGSVLDAVASGVYGGDKQQRRLFHSASFWNGPNATRPDIRLYPAECRTQRRHNHLRPQHLRICASTRRFRTVPPSHYHPLLHHHPRYPQCTAPAISSGAHPSRFPATTSFAG